MIEVYIELKDWKNVNKVMDEAFHFISIYDVPNCTCPTIWV